MARRTLLAGAFLILLLLLIFVGDIDARKTSGSRRGSSGGSSWGWSSNSRSTPKSKTQPHSQGSGNQGQIGWNVPSNQKPASGSNAPKPSAPNSEHISKTSATNVQSHYPSGNPPPYSPSGGYPGHAGNPPPYSAAGGYHAGGNAPPAYGAAGGYHGSSGNPYAGGYHGNPPPYSAAGGYQGGYNPSYGSAGHGYSSVPGQGYNPSYGHSPSMGMSGQPQTVVLKSERPGIGQLAKEAFVFAGVSAGVNAAVNRILPGGIYGHSSPSSSGVVPPPVSHTQITYNNYYNNGTSGEGQPPSGAAAAAAVPAAAPANAAVTNAAAATTTGASNTEAPGQQAAAAAAAQQSQNNSQPEPIFLVSDEELQKFTESLYAKDSNNAFKYISVNLQGHKTDDSTTDDAPENLLDVKAEAYEMPTIKAVLALHDNYELDVHAKESVSSEERREESELLDLFMETEVMKATMKFLAEKSYVPDDEYEFKDMLRRVWFSQFKRIDGEPSSSGFETVFLAEKFDNEIIGLHNWIYLAKQEEAKKLNYLGYIKKLDLGTNGVIVKGRSSLNETVQPITTIFVGTSPELEMALYTLCFYARPNMVCPVSFADAKFIVVSNRVNYFGKDILVAAFPDI